MKTPQQEYDDWIKATVPNHDQYTSFMAGYKCGKAAQQPMTPETVGVKALASATGSEVPTPRTDELLMLLKLTPEYTKQKCTDANRALYLCRKLEHELAAMTATAKQLEGGCHMAIGYIAGSTPDPEKSGTYRYLKSVTSAGLPNAEVSHGGDGK